MINFAALKRRVDQIAKAREGELFVQRHAIDEGETIPTDDGKGLLIVRVFCKPIDARGDNDDERNYG